MYRLAVSLLVSLWLIPTQGLAADQLTINRAEYLSRLEGFWLGQCIANLDLRQPVNAFRLVHRSILVVFSVITCSPSSSRISITTS